MSLSCGSASIIVNENQKVSISAHNFSIDPKEDIVAAVENYEALFSSEADLIRRKKLIALQQLKKDPIITMADKGNITTVLDKEWYDHKIKKCWMIKKFTNIPKPAQPHPHPQDVNLLDSKKITKEANFTLKNSDVTTRRLYGLPNLQKENSIPHSVFSQTHLPTGLLKNYPQYWNHLIEKSKHHVRNFSDFASPIARELLQTDEIMVVFDVVSLFTKVPVQLALNIAKQHL